MVVVVVAHPTAPMATHLLLLVTEAPAMIAATIVRMMTTADVIASRKSHDHYQMEWLVNGSHVKILPYKSFILFLILAMSLMITVVAAVGMVATAVEAMVAAAVATAPAAVEDMVVAAAVAMVVEATVVLVAIE